MIPFTSKILPAFLFIILLTGYQYGKIVSYIGCKLYSVTQKTTTCDCEKQQTKEIGNNEWPYSEKLAIKIFSDDLFFRQVSWACFSSSIYGGNLPCSHEPGILNGLPTPVFQPPRI